MAQLGVWSLTRAALFDWGWLRVCRATFTPHASQGVSLYILVIGIVCFPTWLNEMDGRRLGHK